MGIFRRRRLYPVGRTFLAHFHRKILILGSSGGFQMFFYQFQISTSKSVLVDLILATWEE